MAPKSNHPQFDDADISNLLQGETCLHPIRATQRLSLAPCVVV